jgi:leader peptidase (prepilin peptidase)/N-methyltransferase
MQNITVFGLLVVLVGPAVGSFLAVLADRLPRGEDVVAARSACRSCGAPLRPLQMIPILSFALQRGRCHACGAAIPAWLLYVELLATGAGVLAVLQGDGALSVVLNAVFLWLLIALAVTDLRWFRLPDVLTAALAAAAVGLAVLPGGIGLWDAAIGAALGAGSFAALRSGYRWLRGREGLGLGDVKLMAGLGAFAGPFDLPLLVLVGAVLGLAFAVLVRGADKPALAADRAIPFGTSLCAAAALLWLLN